LDANVLVSGAIQKGAPFGSCQRWLASGDVEVIICPNYSTRSDFQTVVFPSDSSPRFDRLAAVGPAFSADTGD